jgi:hypothetical protein
MRVGGGPQDEVVFAAGNYSWHPNVNRGGGCNSSAFDYTVGDCVVLTPQHFDAMMDWSQAVGVKLVYGLSAMYGACCVRYDDPRIIYGTGHCEGVNLNSSKTRKEKVPLGKCRPWDSNNTYEILKHAHAHPHPPFGFELGDKRPKVIGFDNDFGSGSDPVHNRTLSASVVETAKPFLHAFTYHQYGCGGGPDPDPGMR